MAAGRSAAAHSSNCNSWDNGLVMVIAGALHPEKTWAREWGGGAEDRSKSASVDFAESYIYENIMYATLLFYVRSIYGSVTRQRRRRHPSLVDKLMIYSRLPGVSILIILYK